MVSIIPLRFLMLLKAITDGPADVVIGSRFIDVQWDQRDASVQTVWC